MLVNSSICNNAHQWDKSKIRKIVEPCDHHTIGKIFLPTWPTQDTIIYSYTLDGRYNVNSDYWVAASTATEEEEPSPPLATHPDIAQGIWKLNKAPNIKHFLWKVA